MVFKVVIVVLSYFIGNISPSIIIGKFYGGIDIREHGSGNAGTTNVLRTLGKKAAAATLIIDILKGVTAVLIGKSFGGDELAMLCGLAVFIGHIWPVLYGFRGGKGVATGLGVMVATVPTMALMCGAVGIILIAVTRWVSLGSVIGACLLPITAYFYNPKYILWALAFSLIVIYTHRKNIGRLIKGQESKISFKKKES